MNQGDVVWTVSTLDLKKATPVVGIVEGKLGNNYIVSFGDRRDYIPQELVTTGRQDAERLLKQKTSVKDMSCFQ